jgi:hypothetical protein
MKKSSVVVETVNDKAAEKCIVLNVCSVETPRCPA